MKIWHWILIILGVVVIVGVALIFIIRKNNIQEQSPNETVTNNTETTKEDQIKIKNIGINLDYYNESTQKAGDIEFFKIKPPYDQIFMDFGYKIAAENTADKKESINPHPSFILPLGTKVMALIDGVVVDVPELYSKDYSVQISADGQQNNLIFELEHVKNPVVKKGDKVKAGDIVAEVTDFGSQNYPGYGSVDIAVLRSGTPPQHLCPFLYLDESIKEDIYAKIRALYQSWNEYSGSDIYNVNSYKVPGCLNTDPIDG